MGIQGSLFTSICDSYIHLSRIVVSRDPAGLNGSQRDALSRALSKDVALTVESPSLEEVSICGTLFNDGKTMVEASLDELPSHESNKKKESVDAADDEDVKTGVSKDRNSKKRKQRTGYPSPLALNWIWSGENGISSEWREGSAKSSSRLVHCAGGTLELLSASNGLPQGAASKRKRKLEKDVKEVLPSSSSSSSSSPSSSSSSRLSRMELTRLFRRLQLELIQSHNDSAAEERNGTATTLMTLKESNAEYRRRRELLLSSSHFEGYRPDGPSEAYSFPVL